MRVRLILAAAATLALAACNSDTATNPGTLNPKGATRDDITCRSGYHVATRADGTEYCEADGGSRPAP